MTQTKNPSRQCWLGLAEFLGTFLFFKKLIYLGLVKQNEAATLQKYIPPQKHHKHTAHVQYFSLKDTTRWHMSLETGLTTGNSCLRKH